MERAADREHPTGSGAARISRGYEQRGGYAAARNARAAPDAAGGAGRA